MLQTDSLSPVMRRIDTNRAAQLDFLQRLVAQPSVRGAEAGVQHVIAQELRSFGLQPQLYDVDPDRISTEPGFSLPEWGYAGRPNLSARWKGRGGGRSLILQGHVDVVPVTPASFWTRDPWGGEVHDGRMYGRGAADMKGGISAMTYAVRALHEAGVKLAGDVIIDTVIEEECTGNGALASLVRGSRADAAIIPEPFGQTVLLSQVAVLWSRITVRGAAAHVLGAEGAGAVNAVLKARVVLDAIQELERTANAVTDRPREYRDLPHPLNYSVGTIHSGDWPSTVPAECTLEVRLSAFPGQDLTEVKQHFVQGLLQACARDPWLAKNPPQVEFFAFNAEGFTLDPAEPVITALAAAHKHVTGSAIEPYISTATTDARFYNLYYGIPATCYGPTGGNLHAPDEWVDLASVLDTTRVLAHLLLDWCGSSR